jgi:hypothetical protein
MLHLQHYFYNIIFKIKHKLYISSGSAPPLHQEKILREPLSSGTFCCQKSAVSEGESLHFIKSTSKKQLQEEK